MVIAPGPGGMPRPDLWPYGAQGCSRPEHRKRRGACHDSWVLAANIAADLTAWARVLGFHGPFASLNSPA
jgi:hypothetical protein